MRKGLKMKNKIKEIHPKVCPHCRSRSVFGNHYNHENELNWFCNDCEHRWQTEKKNKPRLM